MKYIKTTKGGAQHYRMSDGRRGAAYPNGYARVSVKAETEALDHVLWQINKKVSYSDLPIAGVNNQRTLRIKEKNLDGALALLKRFDDKNCK
jgi:hypothetical protein